MKPVDHLPKNLANSFGGEQLEDWYTHMNKLELDVFQKHAFNPMQCYFALKASLQGKAEDKLYQIECQLETPRWRNFVPSWFRPTAEDWQAIAMNTSFVQLRYAFRVALIYRYFHHLYQAGDPEKVYDDFKRAVQGDKEPLAD